MPAKSGLRDPYYSGCLDEGFQILGLKQRHLTIAQAEGFYAVHQARPFFGSLVPS